MATTQTQRDKVIIDLIDDLLQPEPYRAYEPDGLITKLTNWRAVTTYGMLEFIGFLLLLGFALPDWYNDAESPSTWAMLYLGVFLITISGVGIILSLRFQREKEAERRIGLAHERELQAKRTEQRGVLLQHLTAAETQRYASMGHFSAQEVARAMVREDREFQAEEARKVRDHELTRDRQAQDAASRDLAKKLEEERRILEARLNIEHPSADQQAQERQRRFQSDLEMIDAIDAMNQSKDEKTRRRAQQLYDRFDRGKL